ncbi:MAG: hypothetical protein ACLU8W_05575 [Clostridia bacterium]
MKRLMEFVPWDIIPYPEGFLYIARENRFKREGSVVFRAFEAESRAFFNVSKRAYFMCKFGPAYEEVCRQLSDLVTCEAANMGKAGSAVIYPGGELGFFTKEGELSSTSQLIYHDNFARGIAMDRDGFWSVVPNGNSVIKYSPRLRRVVFRIGSSTSSTFERPVHISRSESFLYVSNERGCNVRSVNMETYAVKDHRRFSEPVYRYFRSAKQEFVVLSSGVYIL